MKLALTNIVFASMLLASNSILSESPQDQTTQQNDIAYLCSAEFSSGYDYKRDRWIRERFRPNDRYRIRKLENNNWSVYELETEYEHMDCDPILDEVLRCDIKGDFTMNFQTMKFSVTSTASYVHSTRRNRDPVVLTLGSCVEF